MSGEGAAIEAVGEEKREVISPVAQELGNVAMPDIAKVEYANMVTYESPLPNGIVSEGQLAFRPGINTVQIRIS